jgi:hypothetical protein
MRFGIVILMALCLNSTANTIATNDSNIPVTNMRSYDSADGNYCIIPPISMMD